MNYSIDEIIEMLNWGNPEEVQEKGIELAKQVKHVHIFVQPIMDNAKAYWENCAKVVASHSDSELEYVLRGLFEWIADLNWPGARIVLERLNKFERTERFESCRKAITNEATKLNDDSWLYFLTMVK